MAITATNWSASRKVSRIDNVVGARTEVEPALCDTTALATIIIHVLLFRNQELCAMPTYVVSIHIKGVAPVARHSALDDLMDSLGFFPFRPGVPPEGQDEDKTFSQWEYAGNSPLEAFHLTAVLESRIKPEIQNDVDATVSLVRVRANQSQAP